jgi:uncharacterized protein
MYKHYLLAVAPIVALLSVLPASAGPSFDCAKATLADERTICSSAELSQLDNDVVAAYQFVRSRYGNQRAKEINAPLFLARRACGADAACIKEKQVTAIKTFQALGAPTGNQNKNLQAPPNGQPKAACTGLLGTPIIQAYAKKVIAELRGNNALLKGLSP